MTEVDLNFLARQNDRVLYELAGIRAELCVRETMIVRLEGAVTSLSEDVHVVRNQIGRINDRLREGA